MSAVETALYKWIVGANDRREALGFPPGLIEESIALLWDLLGSDYLDRLLVSGSDPIWFFDPERAFHLGRVSFQENRGCDQADFRPVDF